MAFRPEIKVAGQWHGSLMVFATRAEAEHDAEQVFNRWSSAEDWRAIEYKDAEVTAAFVDGKLKFVDSITG